MDHPAKDSVARAIDATEAAGGDPGVAAELDSLRRQRAGAYALTHVLVSRLGGGPIEISRAEWKSLPPTEKLKVDVDPATHDVKLYIERIEP